MSNKWPQLSKAPITEAVIEFQFDDSENVSIDSLVEVVENLSHIYPLQNKRRGSLVTTHVSATTTPATEVVDKGVTGIVASSENQQKVLHLLEDRFAFSHLPPYTEWEGLEKDTFFIWNRVLEKTQIKHIKRIGVRFINRIEIDMPMTDFSDYIINAPVIPEGLPQSLMGYHQRLIFPNPETEEIAVVNQFLEAYDRERNVAPVILDIDVGRLGKFNSSEENLKKILQSLRTYKNEIFFKSISDKIVRKYL